MMTVWWGLDIALVASLITVAGFALASPDLFKAVVLFIAFGLLLSLAWLRLQAPDIALAEAALGAGITGALLLSTLGQIANSMVSEPDQHESDSHDLNGA